MLKFRRCLLRVVVFSCVTLFILALIHSDSIARFPVRSELLLPSVREKVSRRVTSSSFLMSMLRNSTYAPHKAPAAGLSNYRPTNLSKYKAPRFSSPNQMMRNITHTPRNIPAAEISEYPDLSNYDVPRLSSPNLSRALIGGDYEEMRKLIVELDTIFTENNIQYMMMYGTLLGSYFVHDILPWDDDVDLLVRESDRGKMVDLFSHTPRYGHMGVYYRSRHPSNMTKVFYKHSARAGGYPWRWPFVDVMSYTEDEETVCCLRRSGKSVKLNKTTFYPLHKRPFAGLWFPSPRDPLTVLQQKYGTFKCKSHWWDHRREAYGKPKIVSCKDLVDYYPMVYRDPEGTGVRETLKFGEKVLYSVHVNELFGGQTVPFYLGNHDKGPGG